jgi:hypothetical protein
MMVDAADREADCIRALVTVLRRQNATARSVKSAMKGLGYRPAEVLSALEGIGGSTQDEERDLMIKATGSAKRSSKEPKT